MNKNCLTNCATCQHYKPPFLFFKAKCLYAAKSLDFKIRVLRSLIKINGKKNELILNRIFPKLPKNCCACAYYRIKN